MKIAICRLASDVTVVGSKASVSIGPGAQVDLDQVVGAGCTLADALGAALLASFDIVSPADAAPKQLRSPRLVPRAPDAVASVVDKE